MIMTQLIYMTLGGSVLVLLLFVLKRILGNRLSNTVYYYAWLLVLLRFILPIPGLVPTSAEAGTPPVYQAEASTNESGTEAQYYQVTDHQAPIIPHEEITPKETEPASAANEGQISNDDISRTGSVKTVLRSSGFWLGIWVTGAIVSFSIYFLSFTAFSFRMKKSFMTPDIFQRMTYASIKGPKPKLFVSKKNRTPLMYGVFSPKIVLPERIYDEEMLKNIFRHELTHYRRLDTLYKWFTVIVLSTQWFNPLSYLAKHEINRACELSCDETLLRNMTKAEKRSYGNTLLSMAASAALPAGVVATTFCTEKRDLKERLEQIMRYKKNKIRILASLLALILLAGCGVAAGPKNETTEDNTVNNETVSTVDRFLEAIDSDSVIRLEAGQFDLSSASSYGTEERGAHWHWEKVYDGFELVIENADNLTITGAGADKTTIAASPRYANVLRFSNCRGIKLEGFTAGHTPDRAFCSGGVLRFEACNGTSVSDCGMFGCGTVGVIAQDCTDLSVDSSKIYECSDSAMNLNSCRNVSFDRCEVYGNGTREGQASAVSIFSVRQCEGVYITNCSIHDNSVQNFFISAYSKNTAFLSNKVEDNTIYTSVFTLEQYPITVDGCSFRNNDSERFVWYYSQGIYATDIYGKELDKTSLNNMEWREINIGDIKSSVAPEPAPEAASGGEITVTNADEFLAALGPDRTIILDGELFDLSAASNYGSIGGEYYFWAENFDGPGLIINNIEGLTIKAKSNDPKDTTIAAIPRYANVLEFRSCSNISLIGFTAGHTEEPGSCSGGVLDFKNCGGISLEECRLYGCGILGVNCSNCTDFKARDCEIYDCSQGGATFWKCDGIAFSDCDFHDIPSPMLSFSESGNKTWNGEPIEADNCRFDVTEDGNIDLQSLFSAPESGGYVMAVEDNPFFKEAPVQFKEGSEELAFARDVQKDISDSDFESLADKIYFPMNILSPEGSLMILMDRNEFLTCINTADPETIAELQRFVSDDPLEEYGHSEFGETFGSHRIAFVEYEGAKKITCISFGGRLYEYES